MRCGPCSPSFAALPKLRHMAWASVRTFFLAVFGDPVVGMFQGVDPEPVLKLATSLQADDPEAWHPHSEAGNSVGFVANFLSRMSGHLEANALLRKALGQVLEFSVRLEDVVDKKFTAVAQSAAEQGKGRNLSYCEDWGGEPTPADFDAFAATEEGFNAKDLDSMYASFEFFGALRRVRPAIFAAKRKVRLAEARTRARRRRRGTQQAADEDENDRCNKHFPKHPDLTAGVFNVVCPHVITLGFRVMFDPENVGEALSVILERFPKLPKVVFYDVGCKLDRNALRRVRTIFVKHKVKVVLDRVHAKGHTCSPIFFPNEALGRTNGVATQAAEVQHSVSVKFRSHLAYMSPESFMAHRVVQLSLMNLVAAYKLVHPDAKEENQDASMSHFYHSFVSNTCMRDENCGCRGGALVA